MKMMDGTNVTAVVLTPGEEIIPEHVLMQIKTITLMTCQVCQLLLQ